MNDTPALRTLPYTIHKTDCKSVQRGCTQQILQFCIKFKIIIKPPLRTQDKILRVDKFTPCIQKYNNIWTIFCVPQDGQKMNQNMWDKPHSCYKQPRRTLTIDWSNSIQTEWITVQHKLCAILCKYRINYRIYANLVRTLFKVLWVQKTRCASESMVH